MAVVSYDNQSFLLDGRRIWLVSGTIDYAHVPRGLWRARLRAAAQAGLNCICTDVIWSLHEPRPNQFDFDDDYDLRAFVEAVAEEGMYCILRAGPYVGGTWGFGGLPGWLHRECDVRPHHAPPLSLRQGDAKFLTAAARFLGAVMGQVRDLQITAPARTRQRGASRLAAFGRVAGRYHPSQGGGPIVLVQAEHQWLCQNDQQHDMYLREVVRYLRENGCEAPIINCNNLWQPIDGSLDTWAGSEHLAADMRQLVQVRPEAPRLVSSCPPGGRDVWGGEHDKRIDADLHLYRLAGVLSSAAQFNIDPFCGGTHFAFHAGRSGGARDGYFTTSNDSDAPLGEAGGRGEKYHATKRICTFAGQFATLLAHLDPDSNRAGVALTETSHPPAVIHLEGAQGDAVFILKDDRDKTSTVTLTLPDGVELPVYMGNQRVAWLLLNANLAGEAILSYTNLRPWALVGQRLLVLFGPAGSTGLVSINGAHMEVTVPAGKQPRVEQAESVTVVVLNTEQVDACDVRADGIVVGCDGLDENDQPIPRKGWVSVTFIDLDGERHTESSRARRRPTAPRIGAWQYAVPDPLRADTTVAFEDIDGPTALERLDVDAGYGWYRLGQVKAAGRIIAPLCGDRLHLYVDGRLRALLGDGPGASTGPVQASINGDVLVLADNLGRYSAGQRLGEPKGLTHHLMAVKNARLPRAKVVSELAPDPFKMTGYVPHQRTGERVPAEALVWKVRPAGRRPMLLEITALPHPGVVFVNNQPIAVYEGADAPGPLRILLDPNDAHVSGGQNLIKLALYERVAKKIAVSKHVRLYQVTDIITSNADWGFLPWSPPAEDAFDALPKSTPSQPAWYRGQFTVKDTAAPLWLEPRGMSKGQIILNGRNVGRYFIATRQGKAVGPQTHYYLPEPWLRTGDEKPNELLLFDEHGRNPLQCRLVYRV